MADKLTPNQKAYRELVNRIKKRFRDIGKRGYIPLDNVYEEETPKRVLKKDLEKLENIVKNIYKYAEYYNAEDMEYLSGEEGRRLERRRAAELGRQRREERIKKEQFERYKKAAEELERKRQLEKTEEELAEEEAERQRIREELEEQWRQEWEEEQRRSELERLQKQEEEERRFRKARQFTDINIAVEELQLPSELEMALTQIEELIDRWDESIVWSKSLQEVKRVDVDTLKSILDGAIRDMGRETVARNCLEHESEIMDIVGRVLYASGSSYREYGIDSGRTGVQRDLAKFEAIIRGRPLTVEESKRIAELMESSNESV